MDAQQHIIMLPRIRRTDKRFYGVVFGLVVVVFIGWRLSRPKAYDFRELAQSKLQLASGSKSDSCNNAEFHWKPSMKVSVVVSTQAKEEAVISQTISSILAHTEPFLLQEILIATDKHIGEDKTQLLIREFSAYEPIVRIANGNGEERLTNKLVIGHLAKGDIVVFVDDTVVVTPNYLSPLLAALQDHPEVCVTVTSYPSPISTCR